MKIIRHAWVIRDDDDASPVYGYYLFDKSGGYVPEIESARLFDTRKAAKAGLSVERCAWVFKVSEAEVHKAIRSLL